MKIRNLKTKVIGPILLLLPMTCMHLGDDHHSGSHHSMSPYPSFRSSTHSQIPEGMKEMEGMETRQDGKDRR